MATDNAKPSRRSFLKGGAAAAAAGASAGCASDQAAAGPQPRSDDPHTGYVLPDRKEVLRREAWLEDTEVDVAGSLAKTLSSIGGLFKSSTWSDAAMSGNEMENAWAERNAGLAEQQKQSNPVDQGEAEWLAERIGRDGVFHENEKALLKYLKQESPEIHPALQPLLEKVA